MPWRKLDEKAASIVSAVNSEIIREIISKHIDMTRGDSTLRVERVLIARVLITKLEQAIKMDLVARETTEFDNIVLAVTLLEDFIESEKIKSEYG